MIAETLPLQKTQSEIDKIKMTSIRLPMIRSFMTSKRSIRFLHFFFRSILLFSATCDFLTDVSVSTVWVESEYTLDDFYKNRTRRTDPEKFNPEQKMKKQLFTFEMHRYGDTHILMCSKKRNHEKVGER